MRKIIHSLLLGLLLTSFPSQLFAVTEGQLRVAYLYNITKFIQWPEKTFKSEKLPINICIIGKTLCKEELESLQDKIISGHRLNIYYYKNNENFDKCHIAYISDSNKNTFEDVLEKIKGKNIVTISAINMFANKGGMIELRKQKNKIILYINIQSIHNENLLLSSKVLGLARIVK